MERPEICDDEHLFYLDALREGGTINMMGAGEYLQDEFVLDHNSAKKILSYWMKTFGKDDR